MSKKKRKNNPNSSKNNSRKSQVQNKKTQIVILENLKQLSNKNLVKLIGIFIASMIILAIPFLFVDVTSNLYMYFVPAIITSVFLSFKLTGVFNDISEKEKNVMSFCVLMVVPFINALFIAPSSDNLITIALQYFLTNLCIIGIVYFIVFLIFRNSASMTDRESAPRSL